MNKGFCYQENTHFSQAVRCSREKFWDSVRKTSTAWKIDSRREILEAVEQHNSEVINKWLKNEDYGKFLAKKRGLKKLSARQKFFEKSDEERLLAFAQELKDMWLSFSAAMSLTQRLQPARRGKEPLARARMAILFVIVGWLTVT